MTNIGDFFPAGMLARQQVRETARATAELVRRQIQTPQVLGGTVTANQLAAGRVSVHIDGDPPGQSQQLESATWEQFQIGQRVYVLLYPPSGAVVFGPAGPTDPWIPYGVDPQPPLWTTDNQKSPTISRLSAFGGGVEDVSFPAGAATVTRGAGTLTAGRWVYVFVGALSLNSTTPVISNFANSGAPLAWELVRSVNATMPTSAGATNGRGILNLYRAYVPVTQSTSISVTFSTDTTQYMVGMSVLSAANAHLLQTSAVSSAASGTTQNISQSVTTTDDHSAVIGAALQSSVTTSLTVSAGASTSLLSSYDDADQPNEYRAFASASRSTTTPAATAININSDQATNHSWLAIAIEVLGAADSPVIGDGQSIGYYRLRGKSMDLRIAINGGSTTAFGTGTYRLQLPPGFSASPRPPGGAPQVLAGYMRPTTAGNPYRVMAPIDPSATQFDRIIYQDNSSQALDSTHPTTLDAGFRLGLNGTIEVA